MMKAKDSTYFKIDELDDRGVENSPQRRKVMMSAAPRRRAC